MEEENSILVDDPPPPYENTHGSTTKLGMDNLNERWQRMVLWGVIAFTFFWGLVILSILIMGFVSLGLVISSYGPHNTGCTDFQCNVGFEGGICSISFPNSTISACPFNGCVQGSTLSVGCAPVPGDPCPKTVCKSPGTSPPRWIGQLQSGCLVVLILHATSLVYVVTWIFTSCIRGMYPVHP